MPTQITQLLLVLIVSAACIYLSRRKFGKHQVLEYGYGITVLGLINFSYGFLDHPGLTIAFGWVPKATPAETAIYTGAVLAVLGLTLIGVAMYKMRKR